VFVAYVPTTVQLKETVEALQQRVDFGEIQSFEVLLRNWQVKGMSVRPVHQMVAHSAFIIVARRLAHAATRISPPRVDSSLSGRDE
jgi:tRNA (adenine57-N1/adenine58-N1)-methyltransferase